MTGKDTKQAPTRVFLHSAPRTGSTWFWSRFRDAAGTLCYWEPFNEWLLGLTPAQAEGFSHEVWDSRHTPTDPYFREYVPLLQPGGGMPHFHPAMPCEWFIPEGGLRGNLRQKEKDYLSLLIGHAEDRGKVPVLGGWRTLGRAWALRQAYGGFHIFQYRSLWRHWLSILSFKRRNDMTFYVNHIDTICRDDDEFLCHLARRARFLAADSATGRDAKAPPRPWRRTYALARRDDDLARDLELLPEPQAFTLFMGLHIYLYLHAQLTADLEADVSRMARDDAYRAGIEEAVLRGTGLAVSFDGAGENGRTSDGEFDAAAIDWREVRRHANVAVAMLRAYGDEEVLKANAAALVEATMQEMRDGREKAVPGRAPAEPGAKRIGLSMIVKNEAPVIRRCLDSVRPLIDYVLIEDTGSTDGTQEIIRAWLAEVGIPGEVVEEPWRDFAYNRSLALTRLRENRNVDYALIIDADDTLQVPRDFRKPDLDADCYVLEIEDRGIRYRRTQLVRNDQPWCYRGVLHEFLECGETHTTGHLPVVMQRNYDGARRRDSETYRKDAAILERALQTETDAFLVARYTFYLAQSYRDCGQREKAIETYLFRATLGYWQQEVFISLLNAARLKEELGHDRDEVLALYLRASEAVANRAEALHGAARLCRIAGRNKEGYEIGKRGLGLKPPDDGLFVEPWIYDFGLLDEFAVNAYWAGAYRESLDACLRILELATLGPELRKRIVSNARFAFDKLPEGQNPRALEAMIRPAGTLVDGHFLPAPAIVAPRADGPMVSIITPTRDRALFLRQALAYYDSQDYRHIEWLIADDSDTADPYFSALERDDVSYWHQAGRATIGEKRNALIEKARGDIIVHFDDDDFYAPGYVSTMVAALAEQQADLINLRGWYLYDERTKFFGYWDLMRKEGPHYRCDRNGVSLMMLDASNNGGFANNHLGFGFSYAYKRKVWERNRFRDLDWNEDGEFSLAAMGAFRLSGFHDTRGICLHVLHEGTTSTCYPQYQMPAATMESLFAAAARPGPPATKEAGEIERMLPASTAATAQVIHPDRSRDGSGKFPEPGSPPRDVSRVPETDVAAGKRIGSAGLRIVATLTTIPSRIGRIRPVIEAIQAQSVAVHHIELNVPNVCLRDGQAYEIPEWLDRMPGVVLFRTPDYGPITKVAPTLIRHRHDYGTYVWSVDDDYAYPPNQLELLCQRHDPRQRRILTRYGGELRPDASVQWLYGESDVTMLEGFGGVLYPPGCIDADFQEYIEITSANANCRKNDDIVLAMYFNRHHVPIHLYNCPSEETPYMVSGRLDHANVEALSEHGHEENYRQIYAFIKTLELAVGEEPRQEAPPPPPPPAAVRLDLGRLQNAGRKVYSQNDEDGIIEFLTASLGMAVGYFVEIGVGAPSRVTMPDGSLRQGSLEEDGLEANCRLLRERGWQGLMLDSAHYPDSAGVVREFVTALNINQILERHGCRAEIDLLSIDIDGQDFWVWMNLIAQPKIVVIEYNGEIAVDESLVLPFDIEFRWDGTDYQGASLLAMQKLGESKFYTLVYCNGVNAFFVRDDLIVNRADFTIENLYRHLALHARDKRRRPWVVI